METLLNSCKKNIDNQLSDFYEKIQIKLKQLDERQKLLDEKEKELDEKKSEIESYQKVSFVKKMNNQLEKLKKKTRKKNTGM